MKKLSAVIITFNEEKNIRQCLASVSNVADEIIVVDSFSTDGTEQICKEFNVKFVKHKFEGYRDQKNYAMDLAENDYVLSLDADERLSEKLEAMILTEKQNDFPFDAYEFNRRNFIGGKVVRYGEMYPDRKIRLWNRKKGQWSGENVHETVKMNSDATVKHLKADLLHYAYENFQQFAQQLVKFAIIWSEEKFKKGKRIGFLTMIFHSFFRFLRGYFLKFGFLDGYYGFLIARMYANYTLMKYAFLKEKQKKSKNLF